MKVKIMKHKQNKIAILSSNLVQDHEFVYPFYRILEENIDLDIFLPDGNKASGILGMPIPPNKDHPVFDFSEFISENYSMLVLPGGVKSMEILRLNERVLDIVKEFNEKKKLIASICSGAQLLISAKILENRKVSAYYSMKQDILNAGAEFIDQPVVVDENLISSPHYKYVNYWIKEALSIFKKI
tara:strand:+ start:267 stop:821 length:555 start_codon:yes stop_codon:yes gene_type:complete